MYVRGAIFSTYGTFPAVYNLFVKSLFIRNTPHLNTHQYLSTIFQNPQVPLNPTNFVTLKRRFKKTSVLKQSYKIDKQIQFLTEAVHKYEMTTLSLNNKILLQRVIVYYKYTLLK